ncbi:P-loop NTPase family protein [Planctobacterium marinum]|uniref:adenylate kinase n=1 Tax=Planctobacterium marinum TaxID=1631968 RepID=UPI001E5A8E05|nr:adenylate kinase [Planctobacterium marinum]MCC2606873.1 adenylate kinase [Planctobacterium marinum]
MKKVAVFGKPANGKSTLSKKLAVATGIPLYALDSILYQADGEEVCRDQYEQRHEAILDSGSWIIEGFAPMNSPNSFYRRLEAADTLIYIDLPYSVTYWLVTKRCLKGLFVKPEGWPQRSSVLKGTLESFKVLKRCPGFWNEVFLQRIRQQSANKTLHVIRSVSQLNGFVEKYGK